MGNENPKGRLRCVKVSKICSSHCPQPQVGVVAKDVSKFLEYAAPTAPNPRWELLLKMNKVQSYFDHLQDTATCGVDGQVTKMERLTVALTYYKLDILGEEDEAGYHQANRAIDRIAQWKATLRGEKRYRHQQWQVEEGGQSTSIEEATALLTCKKLWVNVNDFITLSKSGAADRVQLKVLTAALVGLLMQRSWQRPGAVTNARLAEFEACKEIDSGGEPVWVMKVFRHKTGQEGPAQITMSEKDHRLIRRYVKYTRPMLDPAGQVDELFVLAGPKPVDHANRELQFVAGKYNINVPSATTLQKVAATATLERCTHGESSLLVRQMSHGPIIHARHYEQVMGPQAAAAAHKLRLQVVGGGSAPRMDKGEDVKAKAKRVAYTEGEISLISLYFAKDLREHKTSKFKRCVEFMNVTKIERTSKKIQDKVRQLGDKSEELQ